MSTGISLPKPEEVGAFYDAANDLIARFQGGSMHYGYWNGPEDDSTFEQASDRLSDILIDKLGPGPDDRVLDVGCGVGTPGVRLATRTGAELVGISISARDVELANARAQQEGCADRARFQHADALKMPFDDDSFDHVLALESIVHMPDRVQVLQQIARVLRPGGSVALTDFVERTPAAAAELPNPSLLKRIQSSMVDKVQKAALAKVIESWHTAPLVRAADYTSFASAAGLEVVEVTDISQNTKYTAHRFYGAVYEYAKHNEVPPEIRKILQAGPGEKRLHWLIEDDPAVGVIIAVLRRPSHG
ncbi:SAM-dependent methyltransferase [Streptomyces sp. NPDC001262]|uniref:SAM-dependent methyltransferase n=1 Tax=Streptomyces TaxID=1883 RepID=UPI0036A95076